MQIEYFVSEYLLIIDFPFKVSTSHTEASLLILELTSREIAFIMALSLN